MLKRIRLAVLAVASLMILAVVSGKIFLAERANRFGEEFRFPVRGYDPHDPFRGRYLALTMESRARVNPEDVPQEGGEAYVSIVRRADGGAAFGELSAAPPAGEVPYLKVNCRYRYWDASDRGEWSFEPPFERFYLNEDLAPAAERRLIRAFADSGSKVELVLNVYRGFACISGLTVDGVPIRELAKSERKDVKP